MSSWADLDDELAAWAHAGLTPRFWWRDDDAQEPTEALERLIALSDAHKVPAHLAVIPHGLSSALAPRLHRAAHIHTVQHGFAHINHEPKGNPASEIGDTRDIALQCADLTDGWQILTRAALPRLLPLLVPPWNTIAAETRRCLPRLGYRALSSYAGRNAQDPVPGLMQLDGHLDPVRWKQGRVFRGTDKMLGLIIETMQAHRAAHDPTPICYLTHHLQTGDDIWDFTDQMFTRLEGRVTWLSLSNLLGAR